MTKDKHTCIGDSSLHEQNDEGEAYHGAEEDSALTPSRRRSRGKPGDDR
jgi:hypothetical protein